jgi:2-(1,2-epoxy-1,2-dihydrophenyl)acetyl-CoA isomerase
MSNEYEHIVYETMGNITKITMNRPEKLNAMNPRMEKELKTAFQHFQDDNNARVLIITGAGQRGFCSGEDVGDLINLEARKPLPKPGELVPTPSPASGTPRALDDIVEKPVIAAVNGVCAGAGYGLALASDIRIGSENARFAHVYMRRALVASCETWYLPRIIGMGAAMYHILNADDIGAEEALRLNLLSKLVPAEKLDEEAFALAGRIAAFDPGAVKFTKKAVHKGIFQDCTSVMEYVSYARMLANLSGASLEAMEGFLEKKD